MGQDTLRVEDLQFAMMGRDVFVRVPGERVGQLRQWLQDLGIGSTLRKESAGYAFVHPHTNLSATRFRDLLASSSRQVG